MRDLDDKNRNAPEAATSKGKEKILHVYYSIEGGRKGNEKA